MLKLIRVVNLILQTFSKRFTTCTIIGQRHTNSINIRAGFCNFLLTASDRFLNTQEFMYYYVLSSFQEFYIAIFLLCFTCNFY